MNGLVILYADETTGSMQRMLDETSRRRTRQLSYNEEHGISPATVQKTINEVLAATAVADVKAARDARRERGKVSKVAESVIRYLTPEQKNDLIEELRREMRQSSKDLEFERAASLRDEIAKLESLSEAWLLQEGYLTLLEKPPGIVSLARARIDWSRTICWGEGGYYSRIFFNLKGREPQARVVLPQNYEAVRSEITRKLEALCDEKGNPLGTKVFKPEAVYPVVRGIAPDLIVYFGDLTWRSVGSIGYGSILTFESDFGPDDANHAEEGICIIHDPALRLTMAVPAGRTWTSWTSHPPYSR